MSVLLSTWLDEHLGGRPDPTLEVVALGLPAVRRLDGILEEAQAEPHQQVASHKTETLPVVAGSSALVATTSLPTAAIMAPGAKSPVAVGPALPKGKKKLNRRRAVFVSVAAVLAALALVFAISSLVSGGVQAAGVLQPAQTVALNFDSTGSINALRVQPGGVVQAGEVLATQNAAALQSKLQADVAKLTADKVLLADGPKPDQTPEQLQSQVAQAQAALASAQTKGSNQAAGDSLSVSNATAQVAADQAMLTSDQASASSACAPGPQGSPAACVSAGHQVAADQAALATAQGDLAMAQQTQAGDASNAQAAIAQAQSAVTTAEANETAGTQGQSPTQVSSEQAAVNADEAASSSDWKALAATRVVAPFAGTVVQVNGATGDLAGPSGVAQTAPQTGVSTPSSGITLFPSAPVPSTDTKQPQQTSLIVLDSRAMDVVAQVGEEDVGSIHVGQGAQVTFPADPGHVYAAKVIEVDPAAVNQSGKVYFLIRLGLESSKWRPLTGPAKLNGLEGLSADVSFD
jgi:multidrug efflux pump subunit AcrA (membrane-fusion protein)